MIFRVMHKEKEYFVNAKDSISAVRKIKDMAKLNANEVNTLKALVEGGGDGESLYRRLKWDTPANIHLSILEKDFLSYILNERETNDNEKRLLKKLVVYDSAVSKVKDGNILVRIVNRNGKLIETKRFPNREKLDNYVNSLENFYDMTKEKELYRNKYNEPDVQDVWTVVVSDNSMKDYSNDEYVKKLKEYKSGFVVISKLILEKDGKNSWADIEPVETLSQAKSLKAHWERWQPMPKGYVIVDCGNSYKIVG